MMAWLNLSLLTRPLVQSMLFHILVVMLGLISWPFLQEKDTNAQPLIIVDVVATLPKTNLADSSAAKSSPEPEQEATRKKPPPPPPLLLTPLARTSTSPSARSPNNSAKAPSCGWATTTR